MFIINNSLSSDVTSYLTSGCMIINNIMIITYIINNIIILHNQYLCVSSESYIIILLHAQLIITYMDIFYIMIIDHVLQYL